MEARHKHLLNQLVTGAVVDFVVKETSNGWVMPLEKHGARTTITIAPLEMRSASVGNIGKEERIALALSRNLIKIGTIRFQCSCATTIAVSFHECGVTLESGIALCRGDKSGWHLVQARTVPYQ